MLQLVFLFLLIFLIIHVAVIFMDSSFFSQNSTSSVQVAEASSVQVAEDFDRTLEFGGTIIERTEFIPLRTADWTTMICEAHLKFI